MKNLELKELGVQEMNTTEMTQVDGGLLGLNLGPLFATIGSIVTNTLTFIGTQLNFIGAALKNL
jgi:hypothetical protein